MTVSRDTCNLKNINLHNTVDNFEGGKLRFYRKQWEELTSDKFILKTIDGYKIELDEKPFQTFIPTPINFSETDTVIVSQEIRKFLSKGIIKETCKGENDEYFSNIFIRPKKDGSVRMILNLKHFNDFVSKIHFKMETLALALTHIQQNDYFASIDLKDSYYSVYVDENDQKYLKFSWEGKVYTFCALPQGLSTSPRIFTKILKPVYATLRKQGYINVPYIDDS